MKSLVKRTLARFGLHLVRSDTLNTLDAHLLDLFTALRINCVLDVGANDGDYGSELRRLGFNGHIVSFEPVGSNFQRLLARIGGDARWKAHQMALGERDGEAEINVLQGHTFSSFLTPSAFGAEHFGQKMNVDRKELVPLRRLEGVLDGMVAGIPEPRIFLKMDTQGYDMQVIRGAGEALRRIQGLQMELAVRQLYDGMSTDLVNTIPTLQAAGFELSGLFPVTRDPGSRLTILELDCVMWRPTTTTTAGGGGSVRRESVTP